MNIRKYADPILVFLVLFLAMLVSVQSFRIRQREATVGALEQAVALRDQWLVDCQKESGEDERP